MTSSARGQSHVVGVTLLLAIALLGIGGLTATVGTVVDGHAATADADRVADAFTGTLDPARTRGVRTGRVAFSEGAITTENRTVRVVRNGSVVAALPANALVYRTGSHRVASLAGGVTTGPPGAASFARPPGLAVGPRAVELGVPVLTTRPSVGASGGVTLRLRANVTHDRRALGSGRFALAVETATPGPWERYARGLNATVERRDFDGDGTPSVVATFPGTRRGFLVVHRTRVTLA
ncbi:DUF7289 family protein [Halocalculus aciditolerans]|uniref:Type IV pilin n=1 Tax=Halocalculus aciditolerans TaxID=1383812 RepID=A0A830F4Z0_9EURY|nr:type IV pilin [Halocalculus aciditolerans]GGL63445.1 hypothetical protein GCM10009039_21690 [Halocalculus aciditolerans]